MLYGPDKETLKSLDQILLKATNGYTFEIDRYEYRYCATPMISQDVPYFQNSNRLLHSHWRRTRGETQTAKRLEILTHPLFIDLN